MKKFFELSSWRTALGNLLPSAHGHQGGSRKAAIGSMLIMAMLFAACGDEDSWSPSARPNDEPGVESSSSGVTPQSSDSETSVSTGTMTDSRDGKTYRTVKIGDQVWMAENLNYAYTGVPYKYDGYTSDSTSWCYGNDPANCTKYGRLYTWAAAMDSVGEWSTNGKGCGYDQTCSPTYPVRGVCPEGWHLPDTTEWKALFTAVGGRSTAGMVLKSTSGWYNSGNGSDAFGFSALPAGDRDGNGGYHYDGNYALFWSSTESYSNLAYGMLLSYLSDSASLYSDYKKFGFSVRCLKD